VVTIRLSKNFVYDVVALNTKKMIRIIPAGGWRNSFPFYGCCSSLRIGRCRSPGIFRESIWIIAVFITFIPIFLIEYSLSLHYRQNNGNYTQRYKDRGKTDGHDAVGDIQYDKGHR
jgi:hypothetical protein